ncbi:MAG: hypothetical protein JXJ04_03330 [Spirochaetales bacterium]|nr:hypothetical protein [Spirochaetales bacterium]
MLLSSKSCLIINLQLKQVTQLVIEHAGIDNPSFLLSISNIKRINLKAIYSDE